MRKLSGLAIVVLLMMASTGTVAAGAPKPAHVAEVTVTLDDYGCVYEGATFAVSVAATAVASEDTQLNYLGVSVREYRAVAAGVGKYYPFATTLDVADWYSNLDGYNQNLTSPQPISMRTDDSDFGTNTKSHHWNEFLSDGEPDPASWFIVEAWADGSANTKGRRSGGNQWDNDQDRIFLRCDPYETYPSSASPWDHWNWEEP